MKLSVALLCLLLFLIEGSWGDTPANCTYEDLLGTWVLQVSKGGHDKSVNCSAEGTGESTWIVTLEKLCVAKDNVGNLGFFHPYLQPGF
ncbi:unnamed protein product [Tetraodon nigroviridis]|uniref:(spotted green pufferfish) hypothetical protein n=1 Tax=Tetraodon nigroviridis TaxID=99883 RepID=Q4T082_TETNG|nr:unnamed protein product [Tetraodon nigroviridis]